MQVKIDLNSFTGHAELTGADVDALTKILIKFFGTDSRYLDGRYVQVKTGQKLAAKLEISTDAEFMSEAAFKTEKTAFEERAAALAEEQRVERAEMVSKIIAQLGCDEEIDVAALDDLLGSKHSLLYWNERQAQNAFGAFYLSDDGFYFYVGKPGAQRQIRISIEGHFSRVEV